MAATGFCVFDFSSYFTDTSATIHLWFSSFPLFHRFYLNRRLCFQLISLFHRYLDNLILHLHQEKHGISSILVLKAYPSCPDIRYISSILASQAQPHTQISAISHLSWSQKPKSVPISLTYLNYLGTTSQISYPDTHNIYSILVQQTKIHTHISSIYQLSWYHRPIFMPRYPPYLNYLGTIIPISYPYICHISSILV